MSKLHTNTTKFIRSSPLFGASSASTLLWTLLFHIMIALASSGRQNPYGVSTTGIQGAGTSGHDASANGYAGSSLVSPLASSGFNSPLRAYAPSPAPVFPANSYGFGFGGYANNGNGGGSGSSNSHGQRQSSGSSYEG